MIVGSNFTGSCIKKDCSLILAEVSLTEVLYIYNFIKNIRHHGSSPCDFANFPEFFENLWADSEYRTFRLLLTPPLPLKTEKDSKFRGLTKN